MSNNKNPLLPTIKIGTDICELERIKSAYKRFGKRFLDRVLTDNEKKYVISNERQMLARLAGRFAAKEATSKLLGTGFNGVYFKEIEILRDDLGKPILSLNKRASELAIKNNLFNLELSISHEKHFAVAVVIAVLKN